MTNLVVEESVVSVFFAALTARSGLLTLPGLTLAHPKWPESCVSTQWRDPPKGNQVTSFPDLRASVCGRNHTVKVWQRFCTARELVTQGSRQHARVCRGRELADAGQRATFDGMRFPFCSDVSVRVTDTQQDEISRRHRVAFWKDSICTSDGDAT